jgi:ABC-type lipoprotein release transport system permease subunit
MGLVILGVAFPALLFAPTLDVQKPFFLNYTAHVSVLSPGVGLSAEPGLVGQIRAHPAVERVVPVRPLSLGISIPPATLMQASIYGVYEDDLEYLVQLFEMSLEQGRLPRPHSNEILLSRALALNRDLQVGDSVGLPVNESDENIPTELVVVGILSGDVETGFLSAEYMESHELYGAAPVHLFLTPIEGRRAEMDEWLRVAALPSGSRVTTFDELVREVRQAKQGMMLLFAAIESTVALVAAVAMAALNHIFFSQRQDEFGVLHAAGFSRGWLVRRAFRETALVVGLAWMLGAVLCLVAMALSQAFMYGPLGLSFDLTDPTPWLFTLPLPLAVVGVSIGTVARTLGRLDPVSIVERR